MCLLTVFIYILGHQIILNLYLTLDYFIIRLKKPKYASTSWSITVSGIRKH